MSIRTSEQINELSAALAKAQARFSAAIKGNTNPAFRSKYADLSAVIEATLEHLNAEGISCMQHPALEYKTVGEGVEAYVTVTTRLLHISGQWLESDLSIPAVQRDRFDAQSVGSAITYACRYALQSIGCVPREDDDGNSATGRGTTEAAQAVAQRKIAEHKAKQSTKVDTLFYVIKDVTNTHTGEVTGKKVGFINVDNYLESNQDRTHEINYAISAVGGRPIKDGTVVVPYEKLDDLLQTLAGELGITVHQLEPSSTVLRS